MNQPAYTVKSPTRSRVHCETTDEVARVHGEVTDEVARVHGEATDEVVRTLRNNQRGRACTTNVPTKIVHTQRRTRISQARPRIVLFRLVLSIMTVVRVENKHRGPQ